MGNNELVHEMYQIFEKYKQNYNDKHVDLEHLIY